MKLKKVGVVGVSCESTAIREMNAEGIKRWSRMTKFVAGLMCNETFKYEEFIYDIVRDKYKVDVDKIVKINVKGDVYVTLTDGTDIKIPLDECKVVSNDWCHHCPDFSAEHADISFGGIGLSGWTMCIIRSEYGQDVWNRALAAGVIEIEPTSKKTPKACCGCSTCSPKSSGAVPGRWSRMLRPAGRSRGSWTRRRKSSSRRNLRPSWPVWTRPVRRSSADRSPGSPGPSHIVEVKTKVVLLFGGRSAEHDVSCVSALHVAAAMDPGRYRVIPVGITRDGDWVLPDISLAGDRRGSVGVTGRQVRRRGHKAGVVRRLGSPHRRLGGWSLRT